MINDFPAKQLAMLCLVKHVEFQFQCHAFAENLARALILSTRGKKKGRSYPL